MIGEIVLNSHWKKYIYNNNAVSVSVYSACTPEMEHTKARKRDRGRQREAGKNGKEIKYDTKSEDV